MIADRRGPSMRASAVTISGAKRSRRNVTEPSSASVSMIGRDVVGAPVALGNHCPQTRSGRRPSPGAVAALEVAEQLLRRPRRPRPRRRRRRRRRRWAPAPRSARPRRRRPAEPAAGDHRRPAHADRRVLGGDDEIGAPGDDRVAGEAAALDDRDPRHDAPTAPPTARTRARRAPRPTG